MIPSLRPRSIQSQILNYILVLFTYKIGFRVSPRCLQLNFPSLLDELWQPQQRSPNWHNTFLLYWRKGSTGINTTPTTTQQKHLHVTLYPRLETPIVTNCKTIKQSALAYVLAARHLLVNILRGCKNWSLCSGFVTDRLCWTLFWYTTRTGLSLLLIWTDNCIAIGLVCYFSKKEVQIQAPRFQSG